jgi:NADPH-dependent curcumin reductase CurA
MTADTNHEVHLVSRPVGMPTPENFKVVETAVPTPGAGEMLIRNVWMSVDPYMRGRMYDRKSYAPPFQLNEAMGGGHVGQVMTSDNADFAVGDYVVGFMGGWREYFVSDGAGLEKVDPDLAPLSAYLGTFGMPGFTAYVGLLRIAELKDGETVFVSGAGGAVGTVACQIAKIKGCRVIASAGSDEKLAWLKDECGVDEVINYKTVASLNEAVKAAAPKGIDVYYENVGGEHLEVAINHMNPFGRIAACGMISQYNATEPTPGPANMAMIVGKSIKIQGFIQTFHLDMRPEFVADMGTWMSQGKLKWQETVREGIDNAAGAFIGLFSGENVGKMVVRLGPDTLD